MTSTPLPPVLVIREERAFWVEKLPTDTWTATLQAINEGCFASSHCYDATGCLWPILKAELQHNPTLMERLLPWRRVPIRLSLGDPKIPAIPVVVSMLARTFESEALEFSFTTQDEMLQQLANLSSPADLIAIVESYA